MPVPVPVDTGGSAYPTAHSDGLTVLDCFALDLMRGMVSTVGGYIQDSSKWPWLAKTCYDLAAIMVAERAKRK